jgi:hypothetical protein
MRLLTVREAATIRAALRLWIETPAHRIPEAVFAASDGPPLQDADVERLLHLLSSPAFRLQIEERPAMATTTLCGAINVHDVRGFHCTLPKGHEGAHVASIGPYTPEAAVLATWL